MPLPTPSAAASRVASSHANKSVSSGGAPGRTILARIVGHASSSRSGAYAIHALVSSSREEVNLTTRRSRHSTVTCAAKSAPPSAPTLQAGMLLEYRKENSNDRAVLVALVAPHGKVNWWGVDQRGLRQSVTPKSVSLYLAADGHSETTVRKLAEAAEWQVAALGADLEVAWQVASDGGSALSLAGLADLLMGDANSAEGLYLTHRALQMDRLFFKPAGGKAGGTAPSSQLYEARPAAQVEASRAVVAAEAVAAADAAAFAAAVAESRKSAKVGGGLASGAAAWSSGPHAQRIGALRAAALSREGVGVLPGPTVALVTESLRIVGVSASDPPLQAPPGKGGPAAAKAQQAAAAAASASASASPTSSGSVVVRPGVRAGAVTLLTELGLFRRHEPLELMRVGMAPGVLPDVCEGAAKALLASPPDDPAKGHRVDLSHLRVYTIDDEGTTEVDDGISIETTADGETKIWVHVADPTRWLNPSGGVIESEAQSRARTLYMPWGFVPMFPTALATGPFSLVPGQPCDAMSVGVVLSASGALQEFEVVSSTIIVTTSLTYTAADDMLAASDDVVGAAWTVESGEALSGFAQQAADLVGIAQASRLRRTYRDGQGAVDVPLPEAKIEVPFQDLDATRPRVTVKRLAQHDSASRQLVAEMMILTGEAVGALGMREGLPLPYRGQELAGLPTSAALEALPLGPCRAHALRCCMTKSTVGSTPSAHASLGLPAYVQFTSPIRRYGDLVAHFQLRAHLQRQPLPFTASSIDAAMGAIADKSRTLGQLEREQEHYWLSEFFRQRSDTPWTALVMGWFREENRLAAVLLEDLGWETITRVDADVKPGDRLQLMLIESGKGAAGPPRFSVTAHFPLSDEEEEGEEEEGEGSE